MSAPAYAPLDDALDVLSHHGPDLTNGNFNRVNVAVLQGKRRIRQIEYTIE